MAHERVRNDARALPDQRVPQDHLLRPTMDDPAVDARGGQRADRRGAATDRPGWIRRAGGRPGR